MSPGPWDEYATAEPAAAPAPAADGPWAAYQEQPAPPRAVQPPENIPQAMEDRLIAGHEARKREGGLLQNIPFGVELMKTPEGRTRFWEAVKSYPSKFIDDTINMVKVPGDVQSGKIDLNTEEGIDHAIGLGALIGLGRLNKLSATGQTSGLSVAMGEQVGRIDRGPMGEIVELPIGGAARSEDFVTASQIVGGEKAPFYVQEKMLKAYEEQGLHPSELAHDAQTDPVVAQRLLSTDMSAGPSGKLDVLHGFSADNGFSGFKPLSEVPDLYRYDGGEGGAFGRQTYLDATGKWVKGENGALGIDAAVRVKTDFKNLFVLTPENVGELQSVVGPNAVQSGPAIAAELKRKGYDGIQVKGFDDGGYQGSVKLDGSIQQDQVVSFAPEKNLIAGEELRLPKRPTNATAAETDAYFEARSKAIDDAFGPPKSETVVDINGKRTVIRDGEVVEGGGGEPPKPPPSPEPGSFDAAQKKILDKISVGESSPKERMSWDKFYTQAVDDLHPLKTADGGPLGAYELARLSRGQFGKAEHFLEYGTFDFNTYATNGKPLAEILKPVAKDMDGMRAFLASKRAVEIEASGRKSGVDLEAAQKVIAEGEGKYGKMAGEVVDYQNNVLKYLRDSGVLSDDAFTAMAEAGKNYVPFYRVVDAGETGGGKGGKSFGPGNPLKKLKGSERDIVDPLESIIKNTYAYVSIAERNAVGIKLIDALKAGGAEVKVAKAPTAKPSISVEGGKAVVSGAPRETYIADVASGKADLPSVHELDQAIKAAREGEKKFAEAEGFTPEQEARIQQLNRIIDNGGRAAEEAMAEKSKILDAVPDTGMDLNIADVESLRQLRREFESLEKSPAENLDAYTDGLVRVLKRYLVKATEGDDFAKAVFAKALSEARKNGIDTKILSDETFKRYLGELSGGDREFMEQQFRSTMRPKIAAEPKPATGPDAELAAYLKEQGIANPDAIVDFVKSAVPEEGGDTLGAFRNGVKETVKVNDPDLVTAFRGLDQTSAGLLTKVLAVPAKTLRAGAVLSPDFIVRNIVRDFMTAFVNSKGVFSPIDTFKGLKSAIRKDADFQDWLKGGGANSTMVALDRRYMQESLQKLNGETGLMERSWNVVKTGGIGSAISGLRMMSELAENATRLGEFKKVVGQNAGLPNKEMIQTGAFASREATLDFARIGASMRAYNMITAFGNAQVQGLDRIGRAFADRPTNTTLKVAGGITLPSVLLWFANKDDERYKELPQWQRDMFWIVMTKDHIYRIPKPFELGVVFGSGVERILDQTIGQNPEAFDNFSKSVQNVITPNFIPTAIQPLFEQWANRSSFSDRTLIPADMEKHLPEYQYTPYTTELSKSLGKIISAFPGVRSTAVGPGAPFGPLARAVTSPILMENYIRSWTGGLGFYAMQAADAGLRKAGLLPDPVKPTDTLADIPVVKAFMVRYPSASAQSIQDFRDQHEVAKKFYDTWAAKAKEGDAEAMQRIQDAGGPMMFVRLDAIKETLSNHSKLVRDIYKNPTIKAEEKRQLIDSLYYNMIEIGKAGKQMVTDSKAALAPTP